MRADHGSPHPTGSLGLLGGWRVGEPPQYNSPSVCLSVTVGGRSPATGPVFRFFAKNFDLEGG